MMFFDNLNKVCKSKNTTPTAVVKSLGLSSSKVTAWKNGSLPKEDIIERLADYLCVDKAVFFDATPSTTYPVEKDEIIFNRNGEVIKKKFTKEQMDYLEKFIRSISNDESDL